MRRFVEFRYALIISISLVWMPKLVPCNSMCVLNALGYRRICGIDYASNVVEMMEQRRIAQKMDGLAYRAVSELAKLTIISLAYLFAG